MTVSETVRKIGRFVLPQRRWLIISGTSQVAYFPPWGDIGLPRGPVAPQVISLGRGRWFRDDKKVAWRDIDRAVGTGDFNVRVTVGEPPEPDKDFRVVELTHKVFSA